MSQAVLIEHLLLFKPKGTWQGHVRGLGPAFEQGPAQQRLLLAARGFVTFYLIAWAQESTCL